MAKTLDRMKNEAALEFHINAKARQFLEECSKTRLPLSDSWPFLAAAFLSRPVALDGKEMTSGQVYAQVYECAPVVVEALARKAIARHLPHLLERAKASAQGPAMAQEAVRLLAKRVKSEGPASVSAASVLMHVVAPHRHPIKDLAALDADAREAALWLLSGMLAGAFKGKDVAAMVSMDVLTAHFGKTH